MQDVKIEKEVVEKSTEKWSEKVEKEESMGYNQYNLRELQNMFDKE